MRQLGIFTDKMRQVLEDTVMAKGIYWVDGYVGKKCDSANAISLIKSGQRVFIGSACGEPQELVRALVEHSRRCTGLEIVRMLSPAWAVKLCQVLAIWLMLM